MSLIDADKNSDNRATPILNADDGVANRMAHKTVGTTYKTAGNADTNRLIFDKSSVKGFDQSNRNNIFIGYNPAISTRPIVRIAKDGFDQSTATNDQLIFNSDQNVFKIVASGNATLASASINTAGANYASGTSQTASIPHGLSYTPAILAYWATANTYSALPRTVQGANTSAGYAIYYISASVDSTNVLFSVAPFGYNISDTFPALTLKYYLLQETAN